MQMQPLNMSLHRIVGSHYNFVRIAGLGGASAIFMGAYCKYLLKDVNDSKVQQESQTFADIANRIHFLHSFALMCMPLAHYPVFVSIGDVYTLWDNMFNTINICIHCTIYICDHQKQVVE